MFDKEFDYEDYDANAWLDNWDEDEEEYDEEYDEDEEAYEEEIQEAEIRPTRPLKSCREILEEYGIHIASINREDSEYTFQLIMKEV